MNENNQTNPTRKNTSAILSNPHTGRKISYIPSKINYMNENNPILRNSRTGFAENLWNENVKKAASAAAAAAPADAAANSNPRKNKTLKKSLGKRNLFQSNANRLKQIQNEENARIAKLKEIENARIANLKDIENAKIVEEYGDPFDFYNSNSKSNMPENVLKNERTNPRTYTINNILNRKNKRSMSNLKNTRPFLTRMKSFVTRPFRSSPEATLTKSTTNNSSSSFRNITNINHANESINTFSHE